MWFAALVVGCGGLGQDDFAERYIDGMCIACGLEGVDCDNWAATQEESAIDRTYVDCHEEWDRELAEECIAGLEAQNGECQLPEACSELNCG